MERILTFLIATYAGRVTSHHSTSPFESGFTAVRTLLYQYALPQGRVYSMASVLCLSPVGLSAQSRLTSELLRFL